MIKSFKHKGLERFFNSGSKAGITASHADRLRLILAVLDAANELKDIQVPDFHLHELKGKRRDTWSVKVNKNWRITFKLKEKRIIDLDIIEVDYEDYH